MALLFTLVGITGANAQFWLEFNWGDAHCNSCIWMQQAMRLSDRQMKEYHHIIHQYGRKIEVEARREHKYWDRSAERIYKFRMERDRKLQKLLSNDQFRLFIRFVREEPKRIHDWYGWYKNPRYPDYHPSSICCRYEDRYWHCQWEYRGNQWSGHFDDGQWYPGKYDHPGNGNGGHVMPGKPSYDDGKWHPRKYDKPKKENKHPAHRPGNGKRQSGRGR